jgi:hypothetical protein
LQLEVTALTELEPEIGQLRAALVPQFHPSSLVAVPLPALAAQEAA